MNTESSLHKPGTAVRLKRSAQRALIWHASAVLPVILAAEFPKSGGTWIARMVAAAAGYRFPRNNLPPHCWNAVLLGHYLSSPFYRKVFAIFRDGRDVMVSAYHHFLFENEWNVPATVEQVRSAVGFEDGSAPYARFNEFLEWMFTGYTRKYSRFSWAEFVRSWAAQDVPCVRYEGMLSDPVGELARLCRELGIETEASELRKIVVENSFERQTGRRPGHAAKSSFTRKGIAGDWKNVFDRDSRELFDRYAGNELILLGYEPDRAWVTAQEDRGPHRPSRAAGGAREL